MAHGKDGRVRDLDGGCLDRGYLATNLGLFWAFWTMDYYREGSQFVLPASVCCRFGRDMRSLYPRYVESRVIYEVKALSKKVNDDLVDLCRCWIYVLTGADATADK